MNIAGGYRLRRLPTGESVVADRVTSVIKAVLARPALVWWELTGCVEHALTAGFSPDASPSEVIGDWRKRSRSAADRGTRVHKAIAGDLSGSALVVDDPYTRSALRAVHATFPRPRPDLRVEQRLATAGGRIAGTADVITADGRVIDWKTCTTLPDAPWLDHEAQVGAYLSLPYLVDEDGTITVERNPAMRPVLVYISPAGFRPFDVEPARAWNLWAAVRTVYEIHKGLA